MLCTKLVIISGFALVYSSTQNVKYRQCEQTGPGGSLINVECIIFKSMTANCQF